MVAALIQGEVSLASHVPADQVATLRSHPRDQDRPL